MRRYHEKVLLLALFLVGASCWGQESYTLPLAKANTALSLPSMTAGHGVLYEAHRSFDPLRFSNELQVSAFDLATHKELKHTVVNVPRVHGERAADGFFLSPDAQTLVYAEIYEPMVLLVLSAKDLTEARHTSDLPFTKADSHRLFAGFDGDGSLNFASIHEANLRFIRMDLSNFKVKSDVVGAKPTYFNVPIVWSPKNRTIWIQLHSEDWGEYSEEGRATGKELNHENGIENGALPRLRDGLVAFYSRNMADEGSIVSYDNDHSTELKLECVPRPYGVSNDSEYFGAICTTTPENVPPGHRGYKTLSSEFLLLKTPGPSIVWRHPMDHLSVADSDDPDTGRQGGAPLLYRIGSKILIVALSKSFALTVYEVPLPNETSVATVSK